VCDVSERQALEGLLASVPAEHPLTGVVHAAGVLDDALVGSLTPDRVAVVLAAKADAAWHLHDLTRDLELGMFVLFSSAAGVLGSPGQGNYAAASTFLDALACYRHARGLAGTSLAWGLWSEYSEMVGQANAVRVSRQGMRGLSAAEGLDLLDAGLTCGEPALVAARLDTAWLARSETVPPLLSGLVHRRGRRAAADATAGDGGLAGRLAGLSDADRAAAVLDLVRAHVAATLGHASPQAVEPGLAFRDLGFDSLTAVELRNRLGAVTGLRLPATAVFDYPTPEALSGYVLSQLAGGPAAADRPMVPVAASTSDDPVVIVGMSCRFPARSRRRRSGIWWLAGGTRSRNSRRTGAGM
jgi:acyl carrier protein